MRSVAIGLALAALSFTPALAADGVAQSATSAGEDAAASATTAGPRVLFVCDGSDLTRRSFAREHGSAEFVTAERAAAKDEAWSAPRCISKSEMRRLRQIQSASLR